MQPVVQLRTNWNECWKMLNQEIPFIFTTLDMVYLIQKQVNLIFYLETKSLITSPVTKILGL